MKIAPIISRLSTLCPSATSVSAANGITTVDDAQLPLVFVHPTSEESDGSNYDNLVVQTYDCTFTLLIAASASADALETIRDECRDALLGYVIEAGYDAIEFSSGEMVDLSASTIWWSDTYTCRRFVRQQ